MEGVAKSAGVLVVEDLWDYLEHSLLVCADSFSLVYEGSLLWVEVREQHEDVFFVIDVSSPINVSQQRHDEFFKWLYQRWYEVLALSDFSNDVPFLAEQYLGGLRLVNFPLDMGADMLHAFNKLACAFLELLRVVSASIYVYLIRRK